MYWYYTKGGSSGPASGPDSGYSRLNLEDYPFPTHGGFVRLDNDLKNEIHPHGVK